MTFIVRMRLEEEGEKFHWVRVGRRWENRVREVHVDLRDLSVCYARVNRTNAFALSITMSKKVKKKKQTNLNMLYVVADEIDSKELGPNLKKWSGYGTGYERLNAILSIRAVVDCKNETHSQLMDEVKGQELYKWLQRKNDPEVRKNVMNAIQAKVRKMHELGVLHNDLHTGNILIDNQNEPWFIDWGFAVMQEKNENNDIWEAAKLEEMADVEIMMKDLFMIDLDDFVRKISKRIEDLHTQERDALTKQLEKNLESTNTANEAAASAAYQKFQAIKKQKEAELIQETNDWKQKVMSSGASGSFNNDHIVNAKNAELDAIYANIKAELDSSGSPTT
jgi:hypothetical protein